MNATARTTRWPGPAPRSRGSSASDRCSSERGTAPQLHSYENQSGEHPRDRAAQAHRGIPDRLGRETGGARSGSGHCQGTGETRLAHAPVECRTASMCQDALMASTVAATENVTALDSMPKGGIAAANQPQTPSATTRAPLTSAAREVKILVFACSPRRERVDRVHVRDRARQSRQRSLEVCRHASRSSGVVTTVRDDHHGAGRAVILSLRSLGGHGEARLLTAWKMPSPLREQVERTTGTLDSVGGRSL